MKVEIVTKDVIELLKTTFAVLDEAYTLNLECSPSKPGFSKLLFPTIKHDGNDKRKNPKEWRLNSRVSEQELRFEFIHQLLTAEQKNYNYSIETPSVKKYIFSANDNNNAYDEFPKIATTDKGNVGESALFDLVLFEGKKRVCYFEFKANNSPAKAYEKDILKLNTDTGDLPCFFINLLVSTNSGTIPNILSKIIKRKTNYENRYLSYKDNFFFVFHCLSSGGTQYLGPSMIDGWHKIEDDEIKESVRDAKYNSGVKQGENRYPDCQYI